MFLAETSATRRLWTVFIPNKPGSMSDYDSQQAYMKMPPFFGGNNPQWFRSDISNQATTMNHQPSKSSTIS